MSDEDYKYITKKSYKNQISSWIKKYNITLFILTLEIKEQYYLQRNITLRSKQKKFIQKIQLEQVIVLLQE